uniref:NAD(P)-binding domain-containing protein n=1 Tax=Tetradesmus obliquus TaxID=3088 RepID=A0A383VWN8_TETOB|eukprot:jgi/Sobl393_1/6960/SZX69222.1
MQGTMRMQSKRTAYAQRPQRRRVLLAKCAVVEPGSTVLVAGATGGVGQLATAKLLERGYKVRALTRKPDQTKQLFSNHPNLEVASADLRQPETLAAVVAGVDAVCCCTGTTAFPSNRWEGNNGPRPTDYDGPHNLLSACPKSLKRFVFVTSAGVERRTEMPWAILNTFGVLKFKRDSEMALEASGLPWTILRPSRLTDGPYTSYDLNTLLQATSGSRREVVLAASDSLFGEASRIAVAEAIVQSLQSTATENKAFAIASVEGEGPGQDAAKWQALFTACYPAGAGAARSAVSV